MFMSPLHVQLWVILGQLQGIGRHDLVRMGMEASVVFRLLFAKVLTGCDEDFSGVRFGPGGGLQEDISACQDRNPTTYLCIVQGPSASCQLMLSRVRWTRAHAL